MPSSPSSKAARRAAAAARARRNAEWHLTRAWAAVRRGDAAGAAYHRRAGELERQQAGALYAASRR